MTNFVNGQTLQRMGVHEPSIGLLKKIIRDTINFAAVGLVIGDRHTDIGGRVAPGQLTEAADHGIDGATRIKHVINNQKPILSGDIFNQIVEAMYSYAGQTLINPRIIRRSPNGDVVSLHTTKSEKLLNRDTDGNPAPPDSNDHGRFKATQQNALCELKRMYQQLISREVLFFAHRLEVLVKERV